MTVSDKVPRKQAVFNNISFNYEDRHTTDFVTLTVC